MAVVLSILKVLGIALLVVLAVILVFLLLVLFVPFRYSLSGVIDDPEGSSDLMHLQLKRDVNCAGELRWLFGAFHVSVSFDGEQHLEIRVFGIPLPLSKLFGKMKKKVDKKEEEKEKEEEQKTIGERIESYFARIEKIWNRLNDAIYAMGTEYGIRARHKLTKNLIPPVKSMLPYEWGLTGVLGLGDPARSAQVFSVQGYLYPLIAGHVAIGTDFDLYRFDLQGAARGKIRLISIPLAGILILLNSDVRRLIRRLRKGPPRHKGIGGGSPEHRKQEAA